MAERGAASPCPACASQSRSISESVTHFVRVLPALADRAQVRSKLCL